jgi:nitrogen fixation/metabolism regulation signal transduction histidine kinase
MAFNRFTLSVLFQVLLIAATSFLMIWSFDQEYLMVAKFTFSLLWALEIVYLLYYVTKTNRSLSVFLESLRGSDFVRNDREARSFEDLNFSYNEIIDVVKNARLEKEAGYHYFQHILELIPVGIISYRKEDGRVEIFNDAARSLLGSKRLSVLEDLNRLLPGLADTVREVPPGTDRQVQTGESFQTVELLLRSAEFSLFNRQIKVVSLQNISQTLEKQQVEAWQKLISVLRHEIMNSAGPVSSLARTLLRMFRNNGEKKDAKEITDQTIGDALTGLQSIETRTQGMMRFVESYRELTKIPRPNRYRQPVDTLLEHLESLMEEQLREKGIELVVENSIPGYAIEIDDKQITQVLINLIKNAAEAFTAAHPDRQIGLKAFVNNQNRCCIAVEDNGQGMADELKEKIFVPFFTTKEAGSGIGLVFARQIMFLHDGRLSVSSVLGQGSRFVLEF